MPKSQAESLRRPVDVIVLVVSGKYEYEFLHAKAECAGSVRPFGHNHTAENSSSILRTEYNMTFVESIDLEIY